MLPIVAGLVVGIVSVTVAAPQESYQTRYDHLDVESILNNRRMVSYYAACLLSKGPCPPQGLELKRVLPEALEGNCGRCTDKQRAIAYRTIKRLRKEYPKIWDQLQSVWDPNDTYVSRFESSFESNEIPGSAASQAPPTLFNRFGESGEASSTSAAPPPITSTTTTSTPLTTKTTTKTTTKATNRPNVISPVFVTNPQQAPPFTTVGANLQATVSFGTNLVGGIVRSLGTLGTKVVESGARLANVVISAALRP